MWKHFSTWQISPHFAPHLSCGDFFLCDIFSSYFSCGDTSPHDNFSYGNFFPHDNFFLHKHRWWCWWQISGMWFFCWKNQHLSKLYEGFTEVIRRHDAFRSNILHHCSMIICNWKMLEMVGVIFVEQGDEYLLQISGEMGNAMRYLENIDSSYYGQVSPRWDLLKRIEHKLVPSFSDPLMTRLHTF